MSQRWGFWEWLAYAPIGASACLLATEEAIKKSPSLRLSMPDWGAWWAFLPLGLLLFSGAIFGLKSLGLVGQRHRTRDQADSEKNGIEQSERSAPASGLAGEAPESAWLVALATGDDQQIAQLIHLQNRATEQQLELSATDAYIELSIYFINASVFALRLERVEGRIKYLGNDLRDEPEIGRTPGLSADADSQRVIQHGGRRRFVIRQWVTPEVVRRIAAGHEADINAGHVNLMTGGVALWFSYINLAGLRREVRIALPSHLG